MAKKDLTYFVRFGDLNLKTQKGYSTVADNASFHAPPASRGFYAMPYVAQDHWLLSGIEKTQPDQFPKVLEWTETMSHEEEGALNKITSAEGYWDDISKRDKIVRRKIRKEFRKAHGYIWHHLGAFVDNCDVIQRHNSWVKTSVKSWQRAFRKSCLTEKALSLDYFSVNTTNEVKGKNGMFDKERYEVFFDEKV